MRGDGVAVGVLSRYFFHLGQSFLEGSLKLVVSRIYALGDHTLDSSPKLTPRGLHRVSSRIFGSPDLDTFDTLTTVFMDSITKHIELFPPYVNHIFRNFCWLHH